MVAPRTQALATCIIFVALSLAAGCESSPGSRGRLLLFPSPPTAPKVLFLTWASGAQEVEGSVSSIVKLAFGDEPINRLAIHKPYGVAARDGVVYVCDTKIPALCRLDFKNHTFSVLGVRDPGRLRKPIHVAIDSAGYKFVADAQRKQIVVFGPDDQFVRALDVPEPSRPVDVAIWENELYVLDNDDSCQIVVLNRQTGEVLRTFGGPGEAPGQFSIPNSLSFDPEGYLYVSDTLNWRVQKLTRDGEPIWAKGSAGHLLGQFGRPRGVRVAPDGIIYVADAATEIIQMFDANGDILMHFGGPGVAPGALVLPAAVAVDASSIPYFKQYIHEDFDAEYLLFVTSQFGRHLISVYAFGSFPQGYEFSQSQISPPPQIDAQEGVKPAAFPPDADNISGPVGEDHQSKRQE